jgi:hypothetical protein
MAAESDAVPRETRDPVPRSDERKHRIAEPLREINSDVRRPASRHVHLAYRLENER